MALFDHVVPSGHLSVLLTRVYELCANDQNQNYERDERVFASLAFLFIKLLLLFYLHSQLVLQLDLITQLLLLLLVAGRGLSFGRRWRR